MSTLLNTELTNTEIGENIIDRQDLNELCSKLFYYELDHENLMDELKKSNDRCDRFFQAYKLSLAEIQFKAACTSKFASALALILFAAYHLFAGRLFPNAAWNPDGSVFLYLLANLSIIITVWLVFRLIMWLYTTIYYEYIKQPVKIEGKES